MHSKIRPIKSFQWSTPHIPWQWLAPGRRCDVELARRPARPPDHAAENRARSNWPVKWPRPAFDPSEARGHGPRTLRADSAGISILETDRGKPIFRWHATAGDFEPYLGGTTPGDFSPCGVVLDRNAPQLMADPVRHYPYIAELSPHVAELLLIPFYRGDTAIGTIWIVASRQGKRFDAEDARVMTNLSLFASAAVQAYTNLDALEAGSRNLREAQSASNQRWPPGAAIWTWDIVNDRVVADANLDRLFAISPDQPPLKNWNLRPRHPSRRPASVSPTVSSSRWNPASTSWRNIGSSSMTARFAGSMPAARSSVTRQARQSRCRRHHRHHRPQAGRARS